MPKINVQHFKQIERLSKQLQQVSREIVLATKEGRPKKDITLLRKEMNEVYAELFSLWPEL